MFKVIIWATDGSRGAAQALPFAKGLAQAHGGRLIVIHVNEIGGVQVAGPVNFNEDEVQAALRKQVEDLKKEGLNANLEVLDVITGGPAPVIADIADKERADLIVVGTRGYGPVAGLLLGSVTLRLLHIVHCPVLTVPPTPESASLSH